MNGLRPYASPGILVIVTLAACGTAGAGQDAEHYEVHRIDVGHATASVEILDERTGPSVAVAGGGSVTILRRNAEGDLEVAEVVPAGENPVDLAAGDLDLDGRNDLVVANHETRYLTLLFGGEAGFGSGSSERLPIDVAPHPHAVVVADIDGDGRPDIVTDDRDRDRLRVYRGLGDGSFEPGDPIPTGGDPYRGMSVADVDGDGRLDVITPNPRSVAIQRGEDAGAFSPLPELEAASVPPFSTAVADLDGDGILDVAAGSGEGPGRVMVWHGRGDGSFARDPAAPYAIADGPTKLSTGDMDGDGVDDLLVTSYLGDEVAILPGGRQDARPLRIRLDDNPWDVAAADVNGDGRMDLIIANDGGSRITVLLAVVGRDTRSPA